MRILLGIDIGGTNVKAALVSVDGAVVSFASTGWSGGAPADAVDAAASLYEQLLADGHDQTPAACGCGCAGLVDRRAGVVRSSPNLPSWHDVKLQEALEKRLSLRTTLENDANAAAYAEYVAGAARGATNAVMLTLGTGVGGGIILEGRLYRGSHGTAGEIGHSTVSFDGPPCSCGARGCLEALTSAASIVARATELMSGGRSSSLAEVAAGRALTARDVGEAANRGDDVAVEALAAAGASLGAGLASVVQILDPDVIVIGGGVAAVGEHLLEPARREMEARVQDADFRAPRIVPAELGGAAGVVGAALLARDGLGPDPSA